MSLQKGLRMRQSHQPLLRGLLPAEQALTSEVRGKGVAMDVRGGLGHCWSGGGLFTLFLVKRYT